MNVNKSIKKSLIEIKERKEDILIKEKIVKNRLSVIFENVNNIKLLSKEKKDNLKIEIVLEILSLREDGLISEDSNIADSMNQLMGTSFLENGIESLFEPIMNRILDALGINGRYVKNLVISHVSKNPSELWDSLSSCEKLTKLIANSLVEASMMTIQERFGANGITSRYIRDSVGKRLKQKNSVQEMESIIYGPVCSTLNGLNDKILSVVDKFKRLKPSNINGS